MYSMTLKGNFIGNDVVLSTDTIRVALRVLGAKSICVGYGGTEVAGNLGEEVKEPVRVYHVTFDSTEDVRDKFVQWMTNTGDDIEHRSCNDVKIVGGGTW